MKSLATACLGFLFLFSSLSFGASWFVSTTDDDGPGSLRESIILSSEGDNIFFDPSLSGATITLTSGPITLSNRRLIGDGLSVPVTIDGNGNSALFTIPNTSGNFVTLIRTVRLTNGRNVFGGAIRCDDELLIQNCIIDNCEATGGWGGAIFLEDSANVTLRNSVIAGNKALLGGGTGSSGGRLIAINSTFQGNWATITTGPAGGACYNSGSSSINIYRNCIIWNNRAGNSISSPDASVTNNGNASASYFDSLVENMNPGGTNFDGTNSANDPKFKSSTSPDNAPIVVGDLRLSLGSPAINAGLNSHNPDPENEPYIDVAGNARVSNGTIDLGAYEQQIHYVDLAATSGSNDGTSWGDAFLTLQSALAVATSGDYIFTAEGTYYPDEGTGQANNTLESTFQLKSGVEIYGGFPSGGETVADRDPATNLVILSGDIDQGGTLGGNAYHVVTGTGTDATAVLDGFTITGGNASNSANRNHIGAGIICDSSGVPTFRNLIVTNNTASAVGGGAYLNVASPTFINVIFSNNTTPTANDGVNGEGAGIYHNISNSFYVNCLFSGNQAANDGGAVSNHNSSPQFTNCTFSGNSSAGNGGAIYNINASDPVLQNCIIWNNQAGSSTTSASASIFHISSSFVSISYSLIANSGGSSSWNTSIGVNGGNNIDIDPLFISPLSPATAPSAAGDFTLSGISPANDVGLNSANTEALDLAGNPRIALSIIDLGAYESFNISPPSITNFVLTTANTLDATTLEFDVTFSEDVFNFNDASDLTIATTGSASSTGISIVGSGDSYTLSLTGVSGEGEFSVTIRDDSDIQDNFGASLTTSETVSGIGRFSASSTVHYVNASNATPAPPYDTWATAANNPQDALPFAIAGDEIWVAAGTYYPDEGTGQTNDDPSSTFNLISNVSLYGGFVGTENSRSQSDPRTHVTTLSGDLDQNGFFSRSIDAYHVVSAIGTTASTVLEGFTITRGHANGSSPDQQRGGGIYCNNASAVTIRSCRFLSNNARFGGAAGNYNGSTPAYINCEFRGNMANDSPGAGSKGGAVSNHSGSHATFTNCLFSGNYSFEFGGAIRNSGSNPTFTNCTIASNDIGDRNQPGVTPTGGSAIFNEDSSSPVFRNCIITFHEFTPIVNEDGGSSSSYFYCVADFPASGDDYGPTNYDPSLDPYFQLPRDPRQAPTLLGDYTVFPASMAIDAGDGVSGSSANTTTTDLAGNPRFDNTIDLGAYEFVNLAPSVTNFVLTTQDTLGATTLEFDVTFSEDVVNFNDSGDLTIASTGSLNYTGVTITGSGNSYDLSLTGVSGEGEFTITIRDDSDIQDSAGVGLTAPSTLSGIERLQLIFTVTSVFDGEASSLRAVLADIPADRIIQFNPSLVEQVMTLTSGPLIIDKNVTIDASNLNAPITIDVRNSNRHRVMQIAENTRVTLENLTIKGGRLLDSNTATSPNGAGILNEGILTLRNVTVCDNHTGNSTYADLNDGNGGDGGNGGGIYNTRALIMTDCTITGNTTGNGSDALEFNVSADNMLGDGGNGGHGAGIYNAGEILIENSTFHSNRTGNGGDGGTEAGFFGGVGGQGGHGAGLYDIGIPSNVFQCTFSLNITGDGGAGGDNGGDPGRGGFGAGIYHNSLSSNLGSCTIVANQTGKAGVPGSGSLEGPPGDAGGLYIAGGSFINMRDCLIAENQGSDSSHDVLHVGIWNSAPLGVNLIGDLAGLGLPLGSNIITGAPKLAALGDYGGPTLTMPPCPDSPAVDATSSSRLTDQRGEARTSGTSADIGASEYQGEDDLLSFWETDWDGDGLVFGIEYAFLKDPHSADANVGDPIFSYDGALNQISFQTTNRPVIYKITRSTSLSGFTSILETPIDPFNPPAGLTVTLTPDPMNGPDLKLDFIDPNPPAGGKAFYRLEVELMSP